LWIKPVEIWDAFKTTLLTNEVKGSVFTIRADGAIETKHYAKFDLPQYEVLADSSRSKFEENIEYTEAVKNKNQLLVEFLKKGKYIEDDKEVKQEKIESKDGPNVCKIRTFSDDEVEELEKELEKKIHA